MADREEGPDAADDLALTIWLDLPRDARTEEVLDRITDTVRAALRTGGQGEAVAWAVEFQGDGSLHESGGDDRWNRGRPCLSRDDAEAELRYCVRRGRLSRIRPLVYGDTLGDSKGEG